MANYDDGSTLPIASASPPDELLDAIAHHATYLRLSFGCVEPFEPDGPGLEPDEESVVAMLDNVMNIQRDPEVQLDDLAVPERGVLVNEAGRELIPRMTTATVDELIGIAAYAIVEASLHRRAVMNATTRALVALGLAEQRRLPEEQ